MAQPTTKDAAPLLTSTMNRLDPAEESALLAQSNELKSTANTNFGSASYENAISGYNSAVDVLPGYLDYEIGVLKSNIAACYIKLQQWKDAVDAATKALDALDLIDPLPKVVEKQGNNGDDTVKGGNEATEKGKSQVEEVDDMTIERLEALQRTGKTLSDVHKIRIKALFRRAKARTEQSGWASLQGAAEDYKTLLSLPYVSPADRRSAQGLSAALSPRIEQAKTQEMGEMMDKLKQLGNGILKPFGLSTNNFQMLKDEKTGGYNLQFNQTK